MRLYLDTADRAAAEDLLRTGLFAGLTTNPMILQRSGLGAAHAPEIHEWAVAAGAREVFFQAWGEDADSLVERGERLRELGPEVVVKVPASRAGAAACARLAARGAPTLLTAVYAPGQVLVAAAAGATYIAPYLGRLNDAGRDGVAEVTAMQEVLAATGASTKILLASVRDVPSMVKLARRGIDCFTIGPPVAEAFFAEHLTAAAVAAFEDAARETSA
ncbi:MAG TPA: transaldolase family protein [Actinomycetes bacterium]